MWAFLPGAQIGSAPVAPSRQPSAVSRLKRAPFSKPISPQTEATRRPSPSVRFPRRAGRPDFPLRPVGRRGRVDPALHPGCKNKTKGPQQLFHRSNISVFFLNIYIIQFFLFNFPLAMLIMFNIKFKNESDKMICANGKTVATVG